jgi:hypothetical protein
MDLVKAGGGRKSVNMNEGWEFEGSVGPMIFIGR